MKSKSSEPDNKYCKKCSAICCKNLAVEINRPRNKFEVENLKWQLHFDTVKVYLHNRKWHQLVEGTCIYLSKDDRCTIYETRPDKCREHNPPECEFFGKYYDIMFNNPQELTDYLKSKKSKKRNL
ncbi:MAG: YkgJ family cysteine cluster protein [Candidatus Omnitrophica bacterium]|nr:YkgJ family cysteine cluster protein [Candidatus Omnitrophota bacterium]MCK5287551.1 YkgJ family cysteine cluster protein [Candidatus Omnitrophota bacterium]MCK5393070.1 YkgJ family cysteine cluster protein [Candidatus Omnitrophota bacterium]MCK5493472.1 YkgJ family cysteine cluster protein [Candidatus Omnitrophota bacterium]